MLVYDDKVQQVARRDDFNEPIRYLAPRWAELLDPATHYSRAAASLIDPLTVVREYGATADGFLSHDGTRYDALVEWSRRLKDVLCMERNCGHWYQSERDRLLSRLSRVFENLPSDADQDTKDAHVRSSVECIVRVALPAFEQKLAHPQQGYFARLLDRVTDTVLAPPSSDEAWGRYDSDLSYLASFVLAHGRDADRVCDECMRDMLEAHGSAGAMERFRAVLTRGQTSYRVAVVLQGASEARTAPGFGCTELRGGWPEGTEAANRRLKRFLPPRRSRDHALGLLIETEAYDVEQARAIAISRAEGLQDHILAEHRLSEVRVRQEVLVHCRTTDEFFKVGTRRRSVIRARTLAPEPVEALRSSLRFYGEARQERANVMSVVHYWVALEALAEGAEVQMKNGAWKAQGPGVYVPWHASALMALTSAKNMVSHLWQLLRPLASTSHPKRWRELEKWLGQAPRKGHVDLRRWCELLVAADGATAAPTPLDPNAPLNEAAAVVRELATDVGTFPLRRLVEVRARLTNGGLLTKWLGSVAATAEVNLMRMKFMRHRAMHQAQFENRSALQVRQAGHDILDSVYEVMPRWLPQRDAPWEVFRDTRARYDGLVASWRNAGPALQLDPNGLVDP